MVYHFQCLQNGHTLRNVGRAQSLRLSNRPWARTSAPRLPSQSHHRSSASPKLYCLVTEAHLGEQFAQGCCLKARQSNLRAVDRESCLQSCIIIVYIYYRCLQVMELASSLNGSSTPLLHSAPALTMPYISVISLASVVGTLGNLLVIGSLGGAVRCRNPRTVGKIFIVNLACSDLIVTSIINPMAIAGICCNRCNLPVYLS